MTRPPPRFGTASTETDFSASLAATLEHDSERAFELARDALQGPDENLAYEIVRHLNLFLVSDPYRAAELVALAVTFRFTDRTQDQLREMYEAFNGRVMDLIQGDDYELSQHYLTPRDSVRKTWNNWMRLRRRHKLPETDAKFVGH